MTVDIGAVGVGRLTRRLADTPRDFLAEPAEVSVAAVVSDVLVTLGGQPLRAVGAAPFVERPDGERNWLRLVMITCWLLAHEELRAAGRAERAHTMLTAVLPRLAGLVDASKFVDDPDRREELARLTLRALGVPPYGETPAQFEDRLSTVDSVRRHEVLIAAREAEERAQAVRKALEEQRAKEAAARYSQV
jgi:hypothetical protein